MVIPYKNLGDQKLFITTQFFDPSSDEPETPISSKNFTDSIAYRSRNLGRLIGVEDGEGFTVERYAAVDSLFHLK